MRLMYGMISMFVALSCGTIGGTYPGMLNEPKEVTLGELARYYNVQSKGLITSTFGFQEQVQNELKFVADPYFQQRVHSLSNFSEEAVQDWFSFDAERFVKESGKADFLSASHRFYSQQPFDWRRQQHARPYRYLNCWGSLFFPPIKTLTFPLSFYNAQFDEAFDTRSVESVYFDPQFQKDLDAETQTELTYGNELKALFNGVESFPEKLRVTASAKTILYVAVMTIVADETGQQLIRNMVNAKRAGVDVRLITEALYTFAISNFSVGVLEREGIPVVRVDDKRLNRLDRVFHNKIWIRDGEEAILGGMNILDYENEGTGFNFLNRDTDVLVNGPAVTSLLQRYISLWKEYDREHRPISLGDSIVEARLTAERAAGVRGSEHYARWLGNPATRMNGICRTAVQGNDAGPQNIARLLLRYLEGAKHSFHIVSPEIEFDLTRSEPETIDKLAALMAKKASGENFYLAYLTNGFDGGLGESSAFVRSRVRDAQLVGETLWEDMLTPMVDKEGRNVSQRVRQTIKPLVASGMKAFQYFNYMHAKQFYFDRILVGIGSWNFDSHSADKNHESAIFCLDENLRRQMESQLVLDMVNSVPIVFGK